MFENHTGLSRTVSSWWLLLGLPGLGVAAASSPSTLSFPPGLFIWRAVFPPQFFPRTVNLHLSPLPAARQNGAIHLQRSGLRMYTYIPSAQYKLSKRP